MDETPGDVPRSIGPLRSSDPPTSSEQGYRLGGWFELPEFKETPFLNGLFLTLIVGTIFSDVSMIIATMFKIHLVDIYYSQSSKIHILPDQGQTRASLAIADEAVNIMLFGKFAVLISSGICMLFWMFCNYKNSIALARVRLRYSAGGAALGLVIPIVSWFRPYLAATEMVKIAKDRVNWTSRRAPFYVHWWWFLNIAVLVVGIFVPIETRAYVGPFRFYLSSYTASFVYLLAILKNSFLIKIVLVVWEGGRHQDELDPDIQPELPRID